MKLIIDIPENTYKLIVRGEENRDFVYKSDLMRSILEGSPLPKNHGRLIDADYLKDMILLHNFHGNNKNIVPYADRRGYRLRQREVDEAIINAPTIIEAERGE